MKRNLLLVFLSLFALSLFAQTPTVAYVDLGVSVNDPVDLVSDGVNDDRLYVVERSGRIRILDLTTRQLLPGNFLDVSSQIVCCGEIGLLGLTFHPDFATNGYFYVNYTSPPRAGIDPLRNRTWNNLTHIARFTASSATATSVSTATEQDVILVDQPFGNHNAGDLAFGPDGYLYVPLGDGGSGNDPQNRAQNDGLLLGKLLRLDVDNPSGGNNYGIPADNPFVGNPSVLDEIYAIGLRNPWRIAFDRTNGDLYIADVGQGDWEEVNFQAGGTAGGQNYGWKPCEGSFQRGSTTIPCNNANFTDPILEYGHDGDTGGFSITGGFVYRGQHAQGLLGYYLAADYVSNNLFLTRQISPGVFSPTVIQNTADSNVPNLSSISTFGEDNFGNLYVGSLGGDRIYEVRTQMSLPVELTSWTALPTAKTVELSWTTATEEDARDFVIERSAGGVNFSPIVTLPAVGNSSVTNRYESRDESPLSGRSFYRLRQRDLDGTETVSDLREVLFFGTAGQPIVYPNPAKRSLNVALPGETVTRKVTLRLFSTDGRLVVERDFDHGNQLQLDLPELASGTYRLLIDRAGEEFALPVVIR